LFGGLGETDTLNQVHERTIESDFLLIVLKSLLEQRADLKFVRQFIQSYLYSDTFIQGRSDVCNRGR
jgi:hypothetical protein